jgi:hypothetical protein
MLHNDEIKDATPSLVQPVGFFSIAEMIQLAKIFNQKNKSDMRVIVTHEQLLDLVSKLIKDAEESKNQLPFRIQIVYTEGNRNFWSAYDILVTGMKITMFNIGVLDNGKHIIFNPGINEHIRQIYVTGKNIQEDGVICSSLRAFCIAVSMSRLPHFHQAIQSALPPREQAKMFSTIDSIDLPAALIKNVESLEFIAEYAEKHQLEANQPLNQKQQSLLTYAKAHTIFPSGSTKAVYVHINHKEIAYRHKLFLHYLNSFRGPISTDPEILKQRMQMMIDYMAILENGLVALQDSTFEKLQSLIEAGIDPNLQAKQDDSYNTALHLAAINGKLEFASWLFAKGVNIHLRESEKNRTVAHLAAQSGNLELVKWFVEQGVTIDKDSSNRTPADYAVQKEHWAILEWLIEQNTPVSEGNLKRIQAKAPKELWEKIEKLRNENSSKCSIS